MNLEFQAITAKEKDKNKYKKGTIRFPTSKTSEGAGGFVHLILQLHRNNSNVTS